MDVIYRGTRQDTFCASKPRELTAVGLYEVRCGTSENDSGAMMLAGHYGCQGPYSVAVENGRWIVSKRLE